MRLVSNHPGVDVEIIKESTGFDLIIFPNRRIDNFHCI